MTDKAPEPSELVQRLRLRADALRSRGHALSAVLEDEAATALEAAQARVRELEARCADYEQVLADKRRLTRELDVAMNGEARAAQQASLCDLIDSAKKISATARREALKEVEQAFRAECIRGERRPLSSILDTIRALMEKPNDQA